jgi:hypothetical protein
VFAIQPLTGGTNVYIGGQFGMVKNTAQFNLAKTSGNGSLVNWKPTPDCTIQSFTQSGSTLYVGGCFGFVANEHRFSVAAFKVKNNALTPFDPEVKYSDNSPAYVDALAAYGNKLFIGAEGPDSVKGQVRGGLVAVDTTTSFPDAFDPRPDNAVRVLSVGANYLFAGGHWTKINGVSTSPYFAAFTLPPLKPASALKFTQIQSTSVNVEWTNGSGERRFIIVSDAHIPKGPTDGKTYVANSVFGAGEKTGVKTFAVYNGTGSSVIVTNLTPNHSYTFSVFEYNGAEAAADYLQDSALVGSIVTGLCPHNSVISPARNVMDACSENKVDGETQGKAFDAHLYPNPATNTAEVYLSGGVKNVTIILKDLDGRILWKIENVSSPVTSIPLQNLSPQVYLINVVIGEANKVLKLVKLK